MGAVSREVVEHLRRVPLTIHRPPHVNVSPHEPLVRTRTGHAARAVATARRGRCARLLPRCVRGCSDGAHWQAARGPLECHHHRRRLIHIRNVVGSVGSVGSIGIGVVGGGSGSVGAAVHRLHGRVVLLCWQLVVAAATLVEQPPEHWLARPFKVLDRTQPKLIQQHVCALRRVHLTTRAPQRTSTRRPRGAHACARVRASNFVRAPPRSCVRAVASVCGRVVGGRRRRARIPSRARDHYSR
jgi:hypothetical protein